MWKRGRGRDLLRQAVAVVFIAVFLATSLVPARPVQASPVDDVINGILDTLGLREIADDAKQTLEDIANGQLPITGNVTDLLSGNTLDAGNAAASTLGAIVSVVQALSAIGKPGFSVIEAVPVNFTEEINLDGIGRVWAKKDDDSISLCVWIDGPGDSQATIGISDADPLCQGQADHFANPTRTPYAFYDVTRDGYSYLMGRLPFGGIGLPAFSLLDYLPWGNGQNIQVKYGALDNTSITVSFDLDLALTADVEFAAEAHGTASLAVTVNPQAADELIDSTMSAMTAKLGEVAIHAVTDANGDPLLLAGDAAKVLKAALDNIAAYSQANPGMIGDATLGVDASGFVGAGVADTTWPILSAAAGLAVGVPLDGPLTMSADAIAALLEAADTAATDFHKLTSEAMMGHLDGDQANAIISHLNQSWEATGRQAVADIASAAWQGVTDSYLSMSASLDIAGSAEGAGGGGNAALGSVNVMRAGATIPIGKVIDATTQPDFLSGTLTGIVSILGELVSEDVSQVAPPSWQTMTNDVLDGTEINVAFSPGVAGIQVTADFPGRALFDAAKTAGTALKTLLMGLVDSVNQESLAPLQTEDLQQVFEDDLVTLRGSTFGIRIGAGASADLGAEATLSVSGGAALYVQANPELILLLASGGTIDDPDITGEGEAGLDISLGSGAGVSIGEGVEAGANGNISVSTSLFHLALEEWDRAKQLLYGTPPSSNAHLASLVVKTPDGVELPLSPSFDPTVTSYSVVVPDGVDRVIIYPTTASATAQGAYGDDGLDHNGGSFTHIFRFDDVDYDTVRVVAEDGTTLDYQLALHRTIRNSLTELRAFSTVTGEELALSPSFSGDVTNYSIIAGAADWARLRFDADPRATVKINGAPQTREEFLRDGTPGFWYHDYVVPFNGGRPETVTIDVTAADPSSPSGTSTRRYTVTVSQGASHDSTAFLSSVLGPDGSIPNFSEPEAGHYDVTAPADAAHIGLRVEETFGSTRVSVSVAGEAPLLHERSVYVALPPDEDPYTIPFDGVAEDGTRTHYSLTVHRNLPLVSSIETCPGTAGPPAVAPAILFTPQNSGASFSASWMAQDDPGHFTAVPIDSIAAGTGCGGEASGTRQVVMSGGPGVLLIKGQAGGVRRDYVAYWNWTRDVVTDLARLRFAGGDDTTWQDVSGFDADRASYDVRIPSGTRSIRIDAQAVDPGALVLVNGRLADPTVDTRVAEGASRAIQVQVYGGPERVKTYVVNVYRERAAESVSPTFTASDLDHGSAALAFTPSYDPQHSDYVLNLKSGQNHVNFRTTMPDRAYKPWSIYCGQSGCSEVGLNDNLSVTEDFSGLDPGQEKTLLWRFDDMALVDSTYRVTVHREDPDNAALKSLAIDLNDGRHGLNVLRPADESGTVVYNLLPQPVEQQNVYFEAVPEEPAASVTVYAPGLTGGMSESAGLIPLVMGSNQIRIVVTAPDGTTERTYEINVERQGHGPIVTVPGDLTIAAGQPLIFTASAVDGHDNPVPIARCEAVSESGTQLIESGGVLPPGEWTVTCIAIGPYQVEGEASFHVSVKDLVPPELTLPDDITVTTPRPDGMTVTFEVYAVDDADGTLTPDCSYDSGARFPIGETAVTCTVADASGNTAFGTFHVTVIRVPDVTAPAWPSGARLTATDSTFDSLTLRWPAATDDVEVVSYAVYRDGTWLATVPGDVESYRVTGLSEGMSYTFQVQAGDQAGNWSVDGPSISTQMARVEGLQPVPPLWASDAQLKATNVGDRSLTLSWPSPGSGVVYYAVYRDDTLLSVISGDTRSYEVTGLLPGTQYTFQVINGDGKYWSPPLSVTVTTAAASDTSAPVWPAGARLLATGLQATSVTLVWPAAQDDTGIAQYAIYEGTTRLATVAGDVYARTLTGLMPDTSYTFHVEAGDAEGNWSTNGPSLTLTTRSPSDDVPPVWPDGAALTASDVRLDGLTLSWPAAEDSSGVSSYVIYEDGAFIGAVGGGTLTYTVDGLTPATAYTFQVKALDGAGNWTTDGLSADATTAPDISAPTWPAGASLTASDVEAQSLTLTWSPASDNVGVVSYAVYRDGQRVATVAGDVRSYIVTGLSPHTTYTFAVQAGDAADNWADGPSLTVTTADVELPPDTAAPNWPPGAELFASDLQPRSVTLTWSKATDDRGVVAYAVYRGGQLVATVAGDVYAHTVTGLSPHTTYTFAVKAGDAAGNWTTAGPSLTVTTPVEPVSPQLSGLIVSEGLLVPPFDPRVGSYVVNVPNAIASVDVTAVVADAVSGTLTIDGRPAVSGTPVTVDLAVGENPVAIVVSSSDGSLSRTYTMTIIRGASSEAAPRPETVSVQGDVQVGSGGTIASADGKVQLQVPGGAVAAPNGASLQFSVTEVPAAQTQELLSQAEVPSGVQALGRVFDFDAELQTDGGTSPVHSFDRPLTLSIALTPAELASVKDPDHIGLFRLNDDGSLTFVGGRIVDGRLVVELDHFSRYLLAEVDVDFSDMAHHWARDDVSLMASKYVVRGLPDGRFDPERQVTRAEFVAMLVRAMGLSLPPAQPQAADTLPSFRDVRASDWFYPEVMAAVQANLVRGYDDGTFRPDAPVTREEAAVLVARAMRGVDNLGSAMDASQAQTWLSPFRDADEVSDWATAGVALAVRSHILRGGTGMTLAPHQGATRAEATVMIARFWRLK